jgi:hypothetical protein
MRKVAALAAVATFATFATLVTSASPAAARTTNHSSAKARCAAVYSRHAKRHSSYRCVIRHPTRLGVINHVHRAPAARPHRNSSTPVAPRTHFRPPTAAAPAVQCAAFASPSGSDAGGNGTIGNPFASVAKLDSSLSNGQTGCLRAGTYGDTGSSTTLSHSGDSSGRITITAYPGDSVTIKGYVGISGGYTTLSHVNIDGSNTLYDHQRSGTSCPYPVSEALGISGANDTLEYDNYFQSIPSLRGNGIGIGFSGQPDNTIIRFNKIHDVGGCEAYDHIIYLSHGNNVQIYDNWMWHDPHGWGVQLYPAPTNARVWGNVIDGAGSGFTIGNEQGDNASGNQVFNNIVMNSTGLPSAGLSRGVAISDYWGGSKGQNNSFSDNVSFNNPGGIARVSDVAIRATTTANPQFVDAANHDYSVQSGSVGSGWSLWSGSES